MKNVRIFAARSVTVGLFSPSPRKVKDRLEAWQVRDCLRKVIARVGRHATPRWIVGVIPMRCTMPGYHVCFRRNRATIERVAFFIHYGYARTHFQTLTPRLYA